jgi:23S rRNA (cytosine1962-C5)-methyltransferase
MFKPDQYQLLDFGNGRRLERFGDITLDRQCPAAEDVSPADPPAWQSADARFESADDQEGRWICRRDLPDRWNVSHGTLQFELKRTPFGHIGLFPEQAENWDWIAAKTERAGGQAFLPAAALRVQHPVVAIHPSSLISHPASCIPHPSVKVLNLFAYTGGSTLAAAAAGAEVVHVDAAGNIVTWARRNAELSGLTGAGIHWITEDAMKFVKRELKRGNRYDAVILDPPSYGHGRRGEVWRLSKHLPRLLEMCNELTAGLCRFAVLTCHTPGYDCDKLADMLKEHFSDMKNGVIEAKTLMLSAASGRQLPSGALARWSLS